MVLIVEHITAYQPILAYLPNIAFSKDIVEVEVSRHLSQLTSLAHWPI